MADPVLLDTCAALWLVGRAPMSTASRTAIQHARATNLGVHISPFTAWEIGTLAAKGRVQFALSPEAWFEALLGLPGVRLAALTPKVLLASTTLPGTPPSDPADRIVAATARIYGYVVITRDRKLLEYARQGHLLAKAC